ncbi:MAG: hypothetical protein NC236_01085 [Mycoplasma sp.]|nr:hypothetical protein [Mycoplasma sp.]
MLFEKFNKFGDTTFRTKNQLLAYSNFLQLIIDKNNNEFSAKEFDKHFKAWVKKEKLYSYKEDDERNRFSFVKKVFSYSGILENSKIIKVKKEEIETFKILRKEKYFFRMLNNYSNNNYKNNHSKPFRKAMEFLYKNRFNKNLNVIDFAISFVVFDGNETFEKLYEMGNNEIIIKIVKNKYKKLYDNDLENLEIKNIDEFKKTFDYKKMSDEEGKPSYNAYELMLIFSDFYNYDWNNLPIRLEKALKKIFKNNTKLKIKNIREEIKKYSKSECVELLFIEKVRALIKKDYYDLFSRWLYGLTLTNTSGVKAQFNDLTKMKLDEKEDYYYMPQENVTTYRYPFSREEIKGFIQNISQNNYDDKLNKKLSKIKILNSTWAEYVVNMGFSYLLEIKPHDFTKFSRTQVTKDLLPVFTAPGRGADFQYFGSEKNAVIVETTIHKTTTEILSHETARVKKHFRDFIRGVNSNKSELNFVSYLNDNEEKIWFKRAVLDWIDDVHKPNAKINVSTFEEISNLL